MSKLKVLNVDTLIKPSRTLVLGGEEHVVNEMSVENFLETTAALDEIEQAGFSLSKQVEKTVDMILRSVPSAPRELLIKVPMTSLQDIVAFVRGDEVVPAADAPVEPAAPAQGAKRRARK